MDAPVTDPLLDMRGIDKAFAGVAALASASLAVAPGEVHALIGQNGAGKSTLIKILTGVYRRDAGTVRFAGRDSDIASPREAQATGISTIYQELNLVPLRSVTENVTLGYEPRGRFGRIRWSEAHRRTRGILAGFGIDIDVRRPLGEFSTAVQQLVAIARAVSLDARLVVMDEPTSSLDEREVRTLFGVVDTLRTAGTSVLYVSHFLDELFRICDAVTVMRDGRSVARRRIADTSKLELVADMLGRDVERIRDSGMTELGGGERRVGDTLLEARGIATRQRLRHVDLDVRRGEILGLAGLLGSGRTETARALFGVDELTGGTLRLDTGRTGAAGDDATRTDATRAAGDTAGSVTGAPRTPADAIRAGLALLGEDRKADGIVPHMSVRENLTLALLPRLTRGGQIRRAEERALVERYVRALGIKTASMDQPIRELSGGNQQKVLLARWLATEPVLLILDEPTRGVDVGAKLEIQTIIRDYVAGGGAVVLISSEFEELVEGADRIVVLQDGRSIAELGNPGITEDALVATMAGAGPDARVPGVEPGATAASVAA